MGNENKGTVTKMQESKIINEIVRLKSVNSRMVGTYRLLAEQVLSDYVNVSVDISDLKQPFDELKQYIVDEVYEKLNSEKKMIDILKKSKKEQGSLNELLFSTQPCFPRQTILIRFGAAIESGIRKYLASKYKDVSGEIAPLIRQFLDKNIQLDIATYKDNTYFVSELKYNFNLDTEKISKIVEKLDLLSITLKKFYGKNGINTNVSFVSLRYPHADDIIRLKPELKAIKNQYILGYVDFFKYFGLDVTKEAWEDFHRTLGDELVSLYSDVCEEETDVVSSQHAS